MSAFPSSFPIRRDEDEVVCESTAELNGLNVFQRGDEHIHINTLQKG